MLVINLGYEKRDCIIWGLLKKESIKPLSENELEHVRPGVKIICDSQTYQDREKFEEYICKKAYELIV